MEEAYNQLYQQFLCLRSLCLKQASLLNQLTAALQKQQETNCPDGETHDTRSTTLKENPQRPPEKQKAQSHLSAVSGTQCGFGGYANNTGASTSHLALKTSELNVDGGFCQTCPKQEAQDLTLARSLETLGWQGVPCTDSKPPDTTLLTVGLPATDRHFLVDSGRSPSDGLLMSDVVLQSHTCDFCQAVFPGDTTTRGEFLRHLYTHFT